jgi:hypothetical protein
MPLALCLSVAERPNSRAPPLGTGWTEEQAPFISISSAHRTHFSFVVAQLSRCTGLNKSSMKLVVGLGLNELWTKFTGSLANELLAIVYKHTLSFNS